MRIAALCERYLHTLSIVYNLLRLLLAVCTLRQMSVLDRSG